ncbi:MAG: MerR family transcriptional regulator [Bacteroidales bacterium]|nr:MerR family transcriptional regulator [Bacteroidales bacterium]
MEASDQNKGKLFYSIGEVANILGVQTSAVRYWEKEFDIIKPRKNKKGNRLFSPEDLDKLRMIHFLLKEKGMTLAGAKKKMTDNPGDVDRNHEVIQSLKNIRKLLVKIQEDLK